MPSIFLINEFDLWYMIKSLSSAIYWAIHDIGRPWYKGVILADIKNAQYNLKFLVYSTRKFGVEFPSLPSSEHYLEKSETFTMWYNFWEEYFKSLKEDVLEEMIAAQNNGEDISKFLPKKSWQENLKKTKTIENK